MHASFVGVFCPDRERNIPDSHRFADCASKGFGDSGSDQRIATTWLAGGNHIFEPQSACINIALSAPVDEIESVGGRAAHASRSQILYRANHALGVPCSHWNHTSADLIEAIIDSTRYEWARVKPHHQALSGFEAGCGIAPRNVGRVHAQIVSGQSQIAGHARSPAGAENTP